MANVVGCTIVAALLSACSLPSETGTTRLYRAVEANDVTSVRSLLREGANPNEQINYALFVKPSLHGSSHYFDPDNGTSVLMVASDNGAREIVGELIAAGANPNLKSRIGKTALMFAAEKCHLDVMELLLAHGADITAVATGGAHEYGADFSGSVLRFSLHCAIRREGTPAVANFVLDRLKPGDVPDEELTRCLSPYWPMPPQLRQRVAALRRRSKS